MDFGWVSKKTQIVFSEVNGAAFFCLPGGPTRLGKTVVIDYADGEYCDVSWTVDEVRARVRWDTDLASMAESVPASDRKPVPTKQARKGKTA